MVTSIDKADLHNSNGCDDDDNKNKITDHVGVVIILSLL